MSIFNPEPSYEPPERDYITVECQHEIYEGETDDYVFSFDDANGKTVTACSECFREHLQDLINEEVYGRPDGLIQLAEIMGVEYKRLWH